MHHLTAIITHLKLQKNHRGYITNQFWFRGSSRRRNKFCQILLQSRYEGFDVVWVTIRHFPLISPGAVNTLLALPHSLCFPLGLTLFDHNGVLSVAPSYLHLRHLEPLPWSPISSWSFSSYS